MYPQTVSLRYSIFYKMWYIGYEKRDHFVLTKFSLKPRLHEHLLTYPGSTRDVRIKAEPRAGSCVYTNASIRRLLSFFVNKQSRRRRSDLHRLAYRRAASIFLPWCSRVVRKIVQKRSTYTWPELARGEHGNPNRAEPARFHLGTEPNATCVKISACTEPVPNPR